jgi:seryl-tRNA synthetase
MLDIKYIRENIDLIKEVVKNKKADVDIDELIRLDEIVAKLKVEIDNLRHKQKSFTKDDIDSARQNKEELKTKEESLIKPQEQFLNLLKKVPNIYSADTPIGQSEDDNVVIKTVGSKPVFSFTPKPHWELGEALGIIDNETAAKVTGARFTYLKGDGAMLEFSLVQYALSILTNQGKIKEIIKQADLDVSPKPFIPVIPPVFIKPEVMEAMGRLEPKDDRYYIESDDLYLIGSAEHTLGPIHMNETLDENELPIRYLGFSTSFRREAGTYGKDTRGILRLHQFDKLEMESFSSPQNSLEEQKFFIAIQEYLMSSLGLSYQLVLKCTADMGDPDFRAIDVETWMPGQNSFRETHTSDLMNDYQSRQLKTKVKNKDGQIELVHTNDATAFATGRVIIAIMENYQQADGSIIVPEALVPFMGKEVINGNNN